MTRVRGALLVLEGPEGVGKTTQARHLARTLEGTGHVAAVYREPGGTAVGERVRDILLDPAHVLTAPTEALLFLASRAELIDAVVQPALGRGEIVVLDRFFLSTYAYQVAGRGLPERLIRAANQLAVQGVVPDLTIVLELPDDEGLARAAVRGARDRIESADAAFHARVRAAFRSCAEPAWQQAHPECGPIVVIDASGTEEDVAGRVLGAVESRLGPMADRPVVGEMP